MKHRVARRETTAVGVWAGLAWLAVRLAAIMAAAVLIGGIVVPRSTGGVSVRAAARTSTGDGCQDDWFSNHGGGGFGDCTGGSNAGDGDPDDPNDDNVGDDDPPPYDDEEPPEGPGECCEYPEIEGCECDGDADGGSGESDDSGDTDGDGDVDEDDDIDDPDPPPFKKYLGTVWGGAASVFLNGIGTPSLWESNLLRPGETAGPLAPSPEGTIVPATGYGIDENTDLVVQLPGRNFELTRNFSGDSPLLRVGSFGPFQMGGWSLSTDACVFPDLVPVSKPHRVIAGDAWRRMGVVVLIQSPIRTTIGFHNYLTYKPEAAWYSQDHVMLPPPSGVINGEDYSLTEEDTRTFRPMGPGLARIVADRLRFRQPFEHDYGVNKNKARLPVWKVIEPGRGTSYFFRACESDTSCINLSKQGGGFDADPAFPYNQATLDKVPAGRLWCQIDEFGNVWSYEYKMLKVDGGTTPRLSAIYLHGQDADGESPGTLAKAVVRFHWKLMRRADGTFLGSRVWHLSMVTVERPYRAEAQGAVKWALTDKVNYEYHGDLLVKLEGALGTLPDLSALGPLMDDLVLVTRSTGVHLPMSLDSREFTVDDGLAWHTQHTHYRYAVHVDPSSSSKLSVQIKGVYGPSQIDALVRDSWADGQGLSLWERGFAIMPAWEGEHRHFDAAALTLMTLNDVAEIAPTRGPGAAMPPLQLWQAADRWTTFHAHARTVPLLGSDDGGSTDPEHRGKVRSEYSKPGLGGPTMRRDFAYSRESEDVYDHVVVNRKARLFTPSMANPFDLRHSYLLRSRVQVVTEWTTESDQASPVPDPWAGEAWTRRRRISTRSEEKELLSFSYEYQAADGTPLGLKSLVSVVPFTVAELVEELNEAGERTRSWLTTHEFDEYNRPTRTIDPGAFAEPYEVDDTPDAWVVKCRLRNWREHVSNHTDPARLGSIQSTEYHDAAEPSDLFEARFAEIQAAGGNTRFQMNYPSTLRVLRSWQGTHGTGGALLEVQEHPGELSYYGRFRRYDWVDHAWVMMPRPDLVGRVWRSRTGEDVNPDEAGEQFESVGFAYGLVDRDTPRMGYPAIASWTLYREREGAEENGPGGSEATREYIDACGRTKYRISPGGVATAFVHDPDSDDGARDLTGAPTEVHQHVTLGNFGSDGIPESFADIAWDQGDGTLTARSRRDVSGRLLLFESADGVASPRAYDVRPYADPHDPDATPAPTARAWTFPPGVDDGKHAGPIATRFIDSAGRVFRESTFAVGGLERNSAGIVTAWTTGQEYSRSGTGYYLSGLAERDVVYPFASVGGVFPGLVPDQDGDRSTPAVTRRVYDGDASPVRSVDALGNTERIEYDARSRAVRTHRGVEGHADQLIEERYYDGEGPERGAVGDGLLTLLETHTGAGHAGDQIRRTRNWYDARHRPTLTGQIDGAGGCVTPLDVTVLDNLDRPVLTARWSAAVTPPGGVWFAVSEQELEEDTSAVGVRRVRHGPRGAVYREETLIERGAEARWQRADHWLDADGREVATSSPGGATLKRRFDPHGRIVGEWTSAGVPGTFADASDPAKGFVLREVLTTHWRGKTLPVLTTLRERTHTTVPSSGSLTDDAIGSDPIEAVATYSAVAYDRAARPVATINYGTNNAASEFTSVGGAAPAPIEAWQNGDVSNAIPGVASESAIVTRTAYDERGQASVASRWLEMNAAGIPTRQEATRTLTDSLGRPYATIENDSNPAGPSAASVTWSTQGGGRWSASGMGTPAPDQNRVTTRVYDHAGNVTRQVAHLRTQTGTQAVQATAFRYAWDEDLDGAAAELPSLGPAAGVLREIRYPSTSGSGEPSDAPIDRVKFAYNALGEQIAVKDQNGTIRDFHRDASGRLIADRVRVFGATSASGPDSHGVAAVDQRVSQIITRHDDHGRVEGVVSCLRPPGDPYDPALNLDPTQSLSALVSNDAVHNFVTYQYDDLLGQVTSFRQSSEGKLPPEGAGPNYREVGFTYERLTNGLGAWWRTAWAKHPDATFADTSDDTEIIFNYVGHPVDGAINRAWGLSLSTNGSIQELVRYERLGVSTFAVTDFRQVGVQLDRTAAADGTRDYDPAGGPVTHSRYGGWDRYGRLLRNSWVRSDFGVGGRKPLWQELYQHDALSRRVQRDETRGNYSYHDEDWRVTYDGLDRVTKTERGRTDAAGLLVTPTTGLPVKQWSLDELGNWMGVTSSRPGSTLPPAVEVRQHNATNEIKSIGNLARTYDANGNLLNVRASLPPSSPDRQRYVVDAWNRVVRVEWLKTPLPTPIFDTLEYSYNGLNHLVLETRTLGGSTPPPPTKVHRFYSPTWQLLLERHESFDGTTWQPGAIERQFFGLRGLDDAILRRIDGNADGDFADAGDLSYHQLTDASFSVIAHVDFSSGLVRQWMSYDAFGAMKVLRTGDFDGSGDFGGIEGVNAEDWTAFNDAFVDPALAPLHCDVDLDGVITGSDYDLFAQLWEESLDSEANPLDEVRLGYAGYVRDPTTGLLLARHRWYDAGVGRWITRDPAGYVDGMSLYLYARGNPFGLVDPMGLSGDEPAETVDYTIIGERTVEVTTTTSTRSWAGAIAESLTLGLFKADRTATPKTESYEWDQSMPSNGMLAGEFIRAAQTGDLPHGVSAEQVEWVEAERKMVAEGLEQVKRGAQDVVISAASAPLFAAAAKAKKAAMDDAAGATVQPGGEKKPHGNTAGDQPADFYKKYDKDGNYLKTGVSQNAKKRYTRKQLEGGRVEVEERGPRREMLQKERDEIEINPGPENHEPWAGKKRPKE